MNKAATIWDEVLARIETKVNQHIFATWFKPTVFVADKGMQLHVRVPNALFSNWLTKHYSVVLEEALTEVEPARLLGLVRHRRSRPPAGRNR